MGRKTGEGATPDAAEVPAPLRAQITPAARVTAADFIDYHMITDYELTQLSRPETGVLGTIGWAAFGLAGGFILQFIRAVSKSDGALQGSDLWGSILFVAASVAATICLVIHYRNRRELKSLAEDIRGRKKYPQE